MAMSDTAEPLSLGEIAIASWGVLGVLALLGQALYRLTPLAMEPIQQQLMNGWQWCLYIGWGLFNCYAEGYRGFQKAFSPRVVARAVHVARHPKPLHVLLAPLFCMALFHAKKKNLILAWGLLVFIVVAVIIIRQLAQPWRGIVDIGVVLGLAWGAVSIVVFFVNALRGRVPETDSLPELAIANSTEPTT